MAAGVDWQTVAMMLWMQNQEGQAAAGSNDPMDTYGPGDNEELRKKAKAILYALADEVDHEIQDEGIPTAPYPQKHPFKKDNKGKEEE